jgi:SLBB domain
VHFFGDLKKPGVYKVSCPATVEELAKACGGWTEFGSAKRLTVIRLKRPSNATMDDPGEPHNKIYKYSEIPRIGEKLILKKDDIIFIPVKQIIGQ